MLFKDFHAAYEPCNMCRLFCGPYIIEHHMQLQVRVVYVVCSVNY